MFANVSHMYGKFHPIWSSFTVVMVNTANSKNILIVFSLFNKLLNNEFLRNLIARKSYKTVKHVVFFSHQSGVAIYSSRVLNCVFHYFRKL